MFASLERFKSLFLIFRDKDSYFDVTDFLNQQEH